VNHFLNLRIVLATFLSYALTAVAQDEGATRQLDDSDLPVAISVLQDVQINAVEENSGADGVEPGSRYSMVILGIRKDQQFQMIDIHLEGGCRILFEDKQYDLASCPWLPGFRDHQENIFTVVKICNPTQPEEAVCQSLE
jgi:hypothetical protein